MDSVHNKKQTKFMIELYQAKESWLLGEGWKWWLTHQHIPKFKSKRH